MQDNSPKSSLEVDADDSSDEEEVTEKSTEYDLKKSYRAFIKSKRVPQYIKDTDPKGYSFIAFALSMQKLYSLEVNQLYYQKKRALPASNVANTEEQLKHWLELALFRTIRRVFKLDLQSDLTKNLAKLCIDKLKSDDKFKKIVEEWIRGIRVFFQQFQSKEILPAFDFMMEQIVKLINRFINELDKSDVKFELPPPILFVQFVNFSETVRAEIFAYLNTNGIVKDDNYFTKNNDRPTIIEKDAIKKMVLTESKKYNGTHKVSSIPFSFVESYFEAIFQRDVEQDDGVLELDGDDFRLKADITEDNLMESDIAAYFCNEDGDCDETIHAYYSYYTLSRLKAELRKEVKTYFVATFRDCLHETKRELEIQLQRGLLGQQHCFESRDPIEFLSNLRLSMRGQKRRIRQEQEELGTISIPAEEFQMSWRFGAQAYLALEKQEITTIGGRNDMVVNLENYRGVANEIVKLRDAVNKQLKYKMNDKLIAFWVQDILRHGAPVSQLTWPKAQHVLSFSDLSPKNQHLFLKFLINFTYLIMGCEVQRQPSGICTQLLLLDLIQEKNLTWLKAISDKDNEKSFGGGLMAMSMGNYINDDDKKVKSQPVSCARALHKHYGIFAVKPYCYSGDAASELGKQQANCVELVRREKAVFEKWLEQEKKTEVSIDEQIDALSAHIGSTYKR